MVTPFVKKKQPTSTLSTPAPAKSFTQQPVSGSDPNRGQSVRDDAPQFRPSQGVANDTSSRAENIASNAQFLTGALSQGVQRAVVQPAQQLFAANERLKTTQEGEPITMGTPPLITPAGGAAGAVKAATSTTAAADAMKVGTVKDLASAANTAKAFAANTKTAAQTTGFFSKITQASSNPLAVAGTLLAIIGTYPFAGFIKEEALQTSGFAVRSAIENGDITGAEEALDFQREILDPDTWRQIIAAVPFGNVIASLKDFYESARIKLAVDEQVIADKKVQLETGESDSDFYQRIDDDRAARTEQERQSDADYYAEIERQRKAAKAAERIEDEKYYANILAQRAKADLEKRKADEDYWAQYYKTLQKSREDSAPSNLKFGLL